jgi:hypothetical protein
VLIEMTGTRQKFHDQRGVGNSTLSVLSTNIPKTIQQIITNSTSPLNRCTMTPVAEVNLKVDSGTTTPKATTAGSSLGFEGNVCGDTLSSQSTYKINSSCPYYKASIAPNPKLLNDFEPSKEQLETVYGGIMEEVNELRLQIASKKTFFCH